MKIKHWTKRKKLSFFQVKCIMQRQNYQCNICQNLLPASCEMDHIITLWAKGLDDFDNLQALCGNCHNTKTRKEDWIRWNSKNQKHKILYAENHDGQIDCFSPYFKTPVKYKYLFVF